MYKYIYIYIYYHIYICTINPVLGVIEKSTNRSPQLGPTFVQRSVQGSQPLHKPESLSK